MPKVPEKSGQIGQESGVIQAMPLIKVREELREQATYDTLTGVLNRGAIIEFLARELSRSGRDNTPLAVVMVDLDHFKTVNDTFGHPVGDDVLRQIAYTMRDSVRRYDGVGRYGGEEFLLVLPGAALRGALHQAERIRGRIARQSVSVSRASWPFPRVSASPRGIRTRRAASRIY